jgi:hypothetical protein
MIDDIERVTIDEAGLPTTPFVPDAAPTDPTFSLDRIPTPPSFAPPVNAAIRTAKHFAMGAFVAMVVLMVALIVVQLRVAGRASAGTASALVVHVERIESVGWRAERFGDLEAPGVHTRTWVVRAPEDFNKGWIYLATFDDEARARAFAAHTKNGAVFAVKQSGRMVLYTQAADPRTASRLLTLVE